MLEKEITYFFGIYLIHVVRILLLYYLQTQCRLYNFIAGHTGKISMRNRPLNICCFLILTYLDLLRLRYLGMNMWWYTQDGLQIWTRFDFLRYIKCYWIIRLYCKVTQPTVWNIAEYQSRAKLSPHFEAILFLSFILSSFFSLFFFETLNWMSNCREKSLTWFTLANLYFSKFEVFDSRW